MTGKTCIKNPNSPLNMDIKEVSIFSEVMWVSVGQLAAKLQAVKIGGLKRILPLGPARASWVQTRLSNRIFFKPLTLTACNFAAS